ncbi:MAG: metallophosphoesterase family protein [Bacteroidota bacterium]
MWRSDPSTTMVIGWNQVSGQQPVLHYGTTDAGQQYEAYPYQQSPNRFVPSKGMKNYFVRLTNLQPATVYYFVIVDSEGQSRRMSFRTAPDNPYERLSVIAGGDSRNYRESRRKANKLVGKLKPHFVLFGGDMTGGDNATQWRAWFDDWQHTITSEGRLTPIVVTRGNHEYSNQSLIDLFDVKERHLYYGLTFGGDLLRVYTLNSLIACGGDQKDWLKEDLTAHPHIRWKMAQYHFAIRPHTRKKRERNGQWLHWASLFEKHQVNLVVESDAHCVKTTYPLRPSREAGSEEGFIRDDKNGTVYVGEGCWGAPLRRNDDDKAWTRNSGSFNQFKWVFIGQDRMEVRTVKTDNADLVAEVHLDDRFSPPEGLSIWHPSNGPVIYIRPRVPEEELHPLLASNGAFPMASGQRREEMKVLDFLARAELNGISLEWQTQFEPTHRLTFELQRSVAEKPFQTIAHVQGQGGVKNNYRIVDESAHAIPKNEVRYRLVHNYANGQARIHLVRQVGQSKDGWKNYERLLPDPRTGLLRVKYVLDDCKDVRIRLLNEQCEAVSRSEYKDQRAGNFLKSINMQKFRKGRYLLIIEAGEEVLLQYRVEHGI